ncbi:MAG: DUF3047 domain-containing protein [Burkholderiales bacterium]
MLRSLICMLATATLAHAAPPLPPGWEEFKINDKKKPTSYFLLREGGRPVLHARAEGSASGLQRRAAFSIAERPIASWSWKVSRLVSKADNSKGGREDSPARILLTFDGDKGKLPKTDQATLYLSRKLSGQDLPYAMLMYIWSNSAPVGSVIENPHSRRIQMVVASSGAAGVGAWQKLSRDVLMDFRRAFKEEPGKLLAYGVMSDTDNTGETIEAWYSEIEFLRRR